MVFAVSAVVSPTVFVSNSDKSMGKKNQEIHKKIVGDIAYFCEEISAAQL